MNHEFSKRKQLIKRIVVNASMALSVIVIVAFVTMFMFGYRLNTSSGDLEQYAFMQFSSVPSSATVTVDGKVVDGKTPNKVSVPAGRHTVVMWRDGYGTWSKTVNIKSGTLTWLNYTLLIPKKLTVEPVTNYETISASLASPNGKYMLVQQQSDMPSFELVDLSSDTIKSTKLAIPSNLYSEPTTVGIAHSFSATKWDDGERYVLVKHTYGDKSEWLVMDTQNMSLTKNITQLFDIAITDIVFSGTSGDIFYVTNSGDLRRLDLSSDTISKPLVSNVTSFNIYKESNVITYVAAGKTGTQERVVGIYRDGDASSSVIRTVNSASDVPLHIATAHYFNEDYVAISENNKVDILSGSYPNTTSDNANSLKVVASFSTTENIKNLSFSPTGEYVFAQSGPSFTSYDLEHQKYVESTVSVTTTAPNLKWIDDNHVWSDADSKLTIREFDGANMHTISSVAIGQDATLTNNGRWLYDINKTATGYQLQRIRMILP